MTGVVVLADPCAERNRCAVGGERAQRGLDDSGWGGRFRDRGAVDKIAVGRAGASATSPRVTRGTAGPPRADRGAVALPCEWEATRAVRISITGLRARPLARTPIEVYLHIVIGTDDATAPRSGRGGGGSAGLARARCARPRATHGYFIDRSAVADTETVSRALVLGLRGSSWKRNKLVITVSRLPPRSGFVQRAGRADARREDA